MDDFPPRGHHVGSLNPGCEQNFHYVFSAVRGFPAWSYDILSDGICVILSGHPLIFKRQVIIGSILAVSFLKSANLDIGYFLKAKGRKWIFKKLRTWGS